MTLRKLAASAPSPNSDIAFLPSLRAVRVLEALRAWALAEPEDDEDEIGDNLESSMLPVFVNLAPILQSVRGPHWPFIFNVLDGDEPQNFLAVYFLILMQYYMYKL